MTTATTTSAAPAVQEKRPPTLAQLIQTMKPEIAKALPRHMSPERMARIATTVLRQTPKLARCTPESFLGALLTASQLGLEPGPIGDAYFVPFGTVCTFIPGYRGLIRLARNSGQLVDIWAEIVYEKDLFKYMLGLRRDLKHEPADGDRGKATYVYAAAQLKDGGTPFVVMTVAEVEKIRKRSRAANDGPWVTDWEAMAKKTLVKQLSKWLPLSPEFNTAAMLDGSVRTDVGPLVDVQPDFVDGEVVSSAPAIESSQSPHWSDAVDAALESEDPIEAAEVYAEENLTGRDAVAYLKAVNDRVAAASPPAPPPPPAKAAAKAAAPKLATKDQLTKLANIRNTERHDEASWVEFVTNVIGDQFEGDAKLTQEQAQRVIDVFNAEAAK